MRNPVRRGCVSKKLIQAAGRTRNGPRSSMRASCGMDCDQEFRTVSSMRPQKSRRSVVSDGLSDPRAQSAGGVRSEDIKVSATDEGGIRESRTSDIVESKFRVLDIVK
jgi:hypothetical protein